MFNLKRKDDRFFDLFTACAEQGALAGDALCHILGDPSNSAARVAEVRDIEHKADEIVHDTMKLLHQAFVTPLDREEIHRLINHLDDVVDFVDEAAAKVVLYRLSNVPPGALALAGHLKAITAEVALGVAQVKTLGHDGKVDTVCAEIHRLENEADETHTRILDHLFNEPGVDPMFVMKWKDVVDSVEAAVDRCEDIANLLEGLSIELG